MNTYNYQGLNYIYPKAYLLSDNGIGQSEYAARQCYNSFGKSENMELQDLNHFVKQGDEAKVNAMTHVLQNVEESDLLQQLSFVHFHESTLEHSVLTFLLTDFSRGVLQELARHRIASYSVMSTRYTLSNLINAFTAQVSTVKGSDKFVKEVLKYDMLVTSDEAYNRLEIKGIFDKLMYHYEKVGHEVWMEMTVAKSVREQIEGKKFNYDSLLEVLNSKDKRNVADPVKHIITDNFKVNAVMTINLRSFKNFLKLRDSGAAWFQIEKLAQEMKRVTPDKYLKLILKDFKRGE